VHGELSVRNQLRVVVGLDVRKFIEVWIQSGVNDWLNAILEFLHDILVLQLLNIVVFPLHVCVEKAASLCRIARAKSFIPS